MRLGRARPVVVLLSVLAFVLGSIAISTPAQATGGLTVEFTANGTLNTFPTPSGHTSFWGQATGAGQLTGISTLGRITTAEFTHLTMPFSGWISYGQPGFPQCPMFGSAANEQSRGHITVGARTMPGTTGITYGVGHGNTGIVTGVVYEFDLAYTRVGPVATILFGAPTGRAWATVFFTTPGVGEDFFTVEAAAVGTAAFYTDYVQATMNCVHGGGPALNYNLTGVVNGAAV